MPTKEEKKLLEDHLKQFKDTERELKNGKKQVVSGWHTEFNRLKTLASQHRVKCQRPKRNDKKEIIEDEYIEYTRPMTVHEYLQWELDAPKRNKDYQKRLKEVKAK